MSIGWMVMMDSFDLLFEHEVFDGLPQLTIDVFSINAQRLGADLLVLRAPHYFDFF